MPENGSHRRSPAQASGQVHATAPPIAGERASPPWPPLCDSSADVAGRLGARGPEAWLLLQLADSAFPTGGFAHSNGLEAAWQHGEVRDRAELLRWLRWSVSQLAPGTLPFINATHALPARLPEVDRFCDAFISNHVANRASRLQGRSFAAALERSFGIPRPPAPFSHLAPVFGASLRALGFDRAAAACLLVFIHLRGLVAAAVRLNIVGPMEAQALQWQLWPVADAVARRGAELGLDDLAQTAPLLDLWQGAHDRLYSRLFQT